MKKAFQLLTATVALWCATASTTAAEPIQLTAGRLPLANAIAGGPLTLFGSDGVRPFTFDGFLKGGDSFIAARESCMPCPAGKPEVSVAIAAFGAIFGTVTYGNETYLTSNGIKETDGLLNLEITGSALLPPL